MRIVQRIVHDKFFSILAHLMHLDVLQSCKMDWICCNVGLVLCNVRLILCKVGLILCNVGLIICNVGFVLCNLCFVLCNTSFVLCKVEVSSPQIWLILCNFGNVLCNCGSVHFYPTPLQKIHSIYVVPHIKTSTNSGYNEMIATDFTASNCIIKGQETFILMFYSNPY